jgi:hypothetical protein
MLHGPALAPVREWATGGRPGAGTGTGGVGDFRGRAEAGSLRRSVRHEPDGGVCRVEGGRSSQVRTSEAGEDLRGGALFPMCRVGGASRPLLLRSSRPS